MSGVRLLDFWSGPSGAGAPIACLATTFTFEADFFSQDCLSRFLELSGVTGEGDRISGIAAVLEEEEKLSETQVTVLVDRSSPAEKRNLRWDLLPVAVLGGLLHAKVTVLIWQNHCRVVIGSANLTSAGYRRQVEYGLALDIAVGCRLPRPLLDELVTELRALVDLAQGSGESGPKARALDTMDLLGRRIAQVNPPGTSEGVHLALAPARPGVNPLERADRVWKGSKPTRATVLSPFWEDANPAPAVSAVRRLLTGRPAESRGVTLLAAIDPFTGAVSAPHSLSAQDGAQLCIFTPPDNERRALHAKLVLLESTDWVAAMVGSSNATSAGLGLSSGQGHRELNLWIGCPLASAEGKVLRALAAHGAPIAAESHSWAETPDEDVPTGPLLPPGFVDCVIGVGPPATARLTLNAAQLPLTWTVRDPAGRMLLDSIGWSGTRQVTVPLKDDALPAYLVVVWVEHGESSQATWTANVDDQSALPPPAELHDVPIEVLLAALASTRPLPVALEHELRRAERPSAPGSIVDDPHQRHDAVHLLRRVRHVSLALARLQQRLGRPATNIDALRCRLMGVLGPVALAERLVRDDQREPLPGEAPFLLAEISRTVAGVDWTAAAAHLDRAEVDRSVAEVQQRLRTLHAQLPPAEDHKLDTYVREALGVGS